MKVAKRVAKVVADGRKRLKLSQAQFAEKLDVTPGTVAGWETARHGIRGSRIRAVAELIDVAPSELVA